jgi:hypothetical protein
VTTDQGWWQVQLGAARRVVHAGGAVADGRLSTLGPRVPGAVAALAEALAGGDRPTIERGIVRLSGTYELNLAHVPPDLEDVAGALTDLNAARWLRRPRAGEPTPPRHDGGGWEGGIT